MSGVSREDEEFTCKHVLPLAYLQPVVDSAERFLEYITIDFTFHPPILTTLFLIKGSQMLKGTLS